MNKTDVIAGVAQKTRISTADCEAVVNAFEEQAGDLLTNKFRKVKIDSTNMISGVSVKSGKSEEDCTKIIAALDEVIDAGLTNKLQFWKRSK